MFFLRLLLWQLLLKLLRIRFLNRSPPGTPPFRCRESRPYHEEPRLKTSLSYSFCTCSSVSALFTNGHVDLVTGSESSTHWSWAVIWKKKKKKNSPQTSLVQFCEILHLLQHSCEQWDESLSDALCNWTDFHSFLILLPMFCFVS